jgi:hypothetical protein
MPTGVSRERQGEYTGHLYFFLGQFFCPAFFTSSLKKNPGTCSLVKALLKKIAGLYTGNRFIFCNNGHHLYTSPLHAGYLWYGDKNLLYIVMSPSPPISEKGV